MKVRKLFMFLAALVSISLNVSGQTTPGKQKMSSDPGTLKPGVVVEAIKKNSEGEKAGVQEDDVILRWSCGDSKGEIESPFDISRIEIEQEPRGPVTVEGFRGAQKRSWALGPAVWGVQTRPNFQGSFLDRYQEGQQFLTAGKLAEAAMRWRAMANQVDLSGQVWLLARTGDALAQGQQWKEVDDAYQEAVEKTRKSGLRMLPSLLRAWAHTFNQRSDWPSAEKYYQQSIAEIQKSDRESLMIAMNLASLGDIAGKQGNLAKAEEYYREVLEIRQKLAPESLAIAASLNNLGNVFWNRGDLARAEQYYGRALDIRKKLAPGSLDVAGSFVGLGIVAKRRGDLANAEEYYVQALDIQKKLAPGSLTVATTINNLGNVALDRGDVARAREYYGQALDIQKKLAPGSLDVAGSYTNFGLVAEDQGDLAKAEEYQHQALDIRQKLAPGSLDVSENLQNLGAIARIRGNLAKAEEYYGQALTIRQKLAPESLNVASTFNNLGNVFWNRGDLARAEEYFEQALEIRKKLAPESLYVASSLHNLGDVAWDQRDLTKAEEYYSHALKIQQNLAPESLNAARSFNNLGSVAVERGDLVKAEEYFGQAMQIQRKLAPGGLDVASSLHNLGDIAKDRGDLVKAEEYYHQAEMIQEKLAPSSSNHAETLGALARVVRRNQQEDAAADLYQRALNMLESQIAQLGGSENVRSGFRATHESYYKEYIDLLMSRNQPELAFQIVERSRARTLLELLATSHLDLRKGVGPAVLDQERSLRDLLRGKVNDRIRLLSGQHTQEQIEAIDREIAASLRQHEDVEATIRAGSPGYAALTQPQPLDAQAVQRLLPDDTLLLEYSLGESHSYVFAITANSLNSYELPTSTEIESKAARLYQLLTERSRILPTENDKQRRTRLGKADAEFRSAANELSRMLLGPVAAGLQQRRLLIVSDGALQYIPFAALPAPELSSRKTPRPLIVQHEIVNLPSASVLAFLRHNTAANKEVVVFADPVFDNQDSRVKSDSAGLEDSRSLSVPSAQLARDLVRSVADMNPGLKGELHLPRLAFTRDEAKAILAVVPQGSGMEAMDFDASRKRAMSGELARYRVVHFATHALVDNIHPELSGLVLSLVDQRGKSVDGFLGLQDIYNLDLSADLVVLSACQTALGKQINGEGMIGLTRGFMYAGASGVMATLWNVSDFATAKLMAHFYKGMEQDGMTPAQALRQAQLALWKSQPTAAPYYWAGFILQGGWQ